MNKPRTEKTAASGPVGCSALLALRSSGYTPGLRSVTTLALSFLRARISRADGDGLPPCFSGAALMLSWARHGTFPAFMRCAAGGAALLMAPLRFHRL